MKKFFISLLMIFIFLSGSYGAESQDSNVYVRQDVFDAKMEALRTEIRAGFQSVSAKLEALDKRIIEVETNTNRRIDDLKTDMTGRINDLKTDMNGRIDDLKTQIVSVESNTANRIDDLKTQIAGVETNTANRINDLKTDMNGRIDDLKTQITGVENNTANRIDDLKTSTNNQLDILKTVIYWVISIIGLFVAFAIFAPSLSEFLKNLRKPSLTLDEVRDFMTEVMDQKFQAFEARLLNSQRP